MSAFEVNKTYASGNSVESVNDVDITYTKILKYTIENASTKSKIMFAKPAAGFG
ncbi:MAG: hypothetical protein QXL94_06655 [Candidatus Parvarchaeum sp.]